MTFDSQPNPQAIGINDLLAAKIAKREMALDPILPVAGSLMLYGTRGIAKTYTTLTMGLAVAAGTSVLRWSAPKARRVLYIDGEMHFGELQKRIAQLKVGLGVEIENDYFRPVAADQNPIPSLATERGQAAIEPLLDRMKLVIVDNISTLCGAAGYNNTMEEWLLRLRRRGIAVILVHHSNKIGDQRGTSRKEDSLDTVIGLHRPEGYQPSDGALFEVHFEKNRGFFGDEANPFEARLVPTPDGQGLTWSTRDLIPTALDNAVTLFRQGCGIREVARLTGMSKSAAGRLRQKAQKEGRLDPATGGSEDEEDTIH